MELGVLFRNCHGNRENETGFIRVLMHVFPVKLQPRKMQFDPCIVWFFEEGKSASRNAYRPNGFPMILGTFLGK